MFLLIPSPLLGPATWRPVEAWLREQGHRARTVDLAHHARTPAGVVDAVATAADGETVVLVPHSNAGLYAPHLATLVDARSTVYVDAALPSAASEGSHTALAPPDFLEFLRSLADDEGVLPPWTDWWDDVDGLFPDGSTRRAVEAEQPRLPLSYFTSQVPVPAGWTAHPSAYLAFGNTYAEEQGRTRLLGWPTRSMAGAHLHALHDPAAVAAAILELSRQVDGSVR